MKTKIGYVIKIKWENDSTSTYLCPRSRTFDVLKSGKELTNEQNIIRNEYWDNVMFSENCNGEDPEIDRVEIFKTKKEASIVMKSVGNGSGEKFEIIPVYIDLL